jgi:hypothetical protein
MSRRVFLRSAAAAAGGLAFGYGLRGVSAVDGASKVIACPVPGGLPAAADVELTVDGQPVGVELYTPAPLPPNTAEWFATSPWTRDMRLYIARLGCSGPCGVVLRAAQRTEPPLVRPKSRGVEAQAEGEAVRFTLPGPGKYYIELPPGPPLLLIADPADAPWYRLEGRPSRYFGPGVHEPGLMRLADGETVHIAPGALVYGGFEGSPAGARVIGAGVLDGSRLRRRMVSFRDAADVEVSGVIIRGGRGWQNTLTGCRNVTYGGVSVVSATQSGDGIDPVGSSGVRIEDCFFRCTDDCIAVKARDAEGIVKDISVKGCVMVGRCFADGFTIGFEMVAKSVSGIRVEDCDILCARGGNMVGSHSAFSIICDGPGAVSDVTFQDIRVEEQVERLFELHVTDGQSYVHEPPGSIERVVVRNAAWEREAPIILHGQSAGHMVKDVSFERCTAAGRPLAEVKDRLVQQNEFVSGVRYG